MSVGKKTPFKVGDEINSGLSFDYWQNIHLWAFDARKMATVPSAEYEVHVLFCSVLQRCPLSGPPIDSSRTDASQGSACVCKEDKQGVDHVTL